MVEIHKGPYIRPQGSNAPSISDSADHFNIAYSCKLFMKFYMMHMIMIQSFSLSYASYTLNVKTQMYTTYIL